MWKNDRFIVKTCFIILALLFWKGYYAFHITYQEQFQLFLFTSGYWTDKCLHPGGICEYAAEFLTQFFHNQWAGAIILTCVLLCVQALTYKLMPATRRKDWLYLSYLPAILSWCFLCDENNMLAGIIALVTTLAIALIPHSIQNAPLRWGCIILLTPFVYWIAGGIHWLFAVLTLIQELLLWKPYKKAVRIAGSLLFLCIAFLCPYITSFYLQYPVIRLMTGIGYYRYPTGIPLNGILACASVCLALLLSICLPPIKEKRKRIAKGMQIAALGILGWLGIYYACDWQKEKVMSYDHYAYTRQWDKIIRMAEKETPSTPLEVVCLNLALGKTGQLGERMFQFYQNGTGGLLPDFIRDFNSPLIVNEVYYHLGMINTSQRFTFEAMEAIPSFQKSARCYQRLAETNIINGDYAVAEKYLKALQHTLFYKEWANDALSYLHDEKKINAHPEWGRLRSYLYKEDFLFDESQKDIILGILLNSNPNNRMAFEYLLAYELLNKDINAFLRYYPLGKDMGYTQIPRSYQEALSYVWTQQHSSFKGMPWSISPAVQQEITEFARAYVHNPSNESFFKQRFEHTYWYYLLFR